MTESERRWNCGTSGSPKAELCEAQRCINTSSGINPDSTFFTALPWSPSLRSVEPRLTRHRWRCRLITCRRYVPATQSSRDARSLRPKVRVPGFIFADDEPFFILQLFRKLFVILHCNPSRRSRKGDVGGAAITFWKRLLDALSWQVETWKISITVKNVANGRCLVDMYNLSIVTA